MAGGDNSAVALGHAGDVGDLLEGTDSHHCTRIGLPVPAELDDHIVDLLLGWSGSILAHIVVD